MEGIFKGLFFRRRLVVFKGFGKLDIVLKGTSAL